MPYHDAVQTPAPAAQVTVHWEQARVFIAPSQARGGAADDDGAEPEPRREAGAATGARAERLRWATPEETEEMWGDEDDWESY